MPEYIQMPRRARPNWECSVNGPLGVNGQTTQSRARAHWV